MDLGWGGVVSGGRWPGQEGTGFCGSGRRQALRFPAGGAGVCQCLTRKPSRDPGGHGPCGICAPNSGGFTRSHRGPACTPLPSGKSRGRGWERWGAGCRLGRARPGAGWGEGEDEGRSHCLTSCPSSVGRTEQTERGQGQGPDAEVCSQPQAADTLHTVQSFVNHNFAIAPCGLGNFSKLFITTF